MLDDARLSAVGLAIEYLAGLTDYEPAEPRELPAAQFRRSMRFTSVITMKRMAARGMPLPQASQAAMLRSSYAAQRFVLDAERDVVSLTAVQDPDTEGWRRVGEGDCDFCRMLIGRGAVYTRETADFQSHDRCKCIPELVIGGRRG